VNPLQHILIFAVRAYRLTLSPAQALLFGPAGGCRLPDGALYLFVSFPALRTG